MTRDEILVRRLAENEFTLLRRLRLAALADTPTMFLQTFDEAASYSDEDWRTRARRYAEAASGICFVAHRRMDAIGMAFGFVDAERNSVARVGGMWVTPKARRMGAGAKLLGAVRQWAAERRCEELRLHVFHAGRDAESFYRSQGFRVLAPEPDKDGFVEYGERLPVA
jgi:GNAT superfamily N-acetyltransferase